MKDIIHDEVKNIIVIQTAFIGDTALALFFCYNIKILFPNAKITFISTPVAASLIRSCTIIDDCIAFDKRKEYKKIRDVKKFAEKINELKPDIVFSLHRSLRTSILVKNINSKKKIGFSNAAMSSVYDIKCSYYNYQHETQKNNQLLKPFGYTESDEYPILNFNGESEIDGADQSKELIYLSPGSVWETKQWIPEYFNKVAKELENLGYQVVIGGSDKEIDLCSFVANGTNAINIAGKLKLNETINVIKKCKLVVCNDSAATHMAGLAGIKCLSIYGATSEIFGFYPISHGAKTIKNEQINCSPCAIHGERKCPLGHFKCMRGLAPETVMERIAEMLKETN